MNKTLLVILILVFAGCSKGPRVGDWYENIPTKKRVKVEFVGTGQDVKMRYAGKAESYRKWRDRMAEEIDSLNQLSQEYDEAKQWRMELFNKYQEEYIRWDVESSEYRYVVVDDDIIIYEIFESDYAKINKQSN